MARKKSPSFDDVVFSFGKCPECGGSVEATRTRADFWSFDATKGWVMRGLLGTEERVSFYCENDCELDESQVPEFPYTEE